MPLLNIFITFTVLIALELFYFKIAGRFNITDQPNHRSSHQELTLRGGGIIFAIGLLLYPFFFGFQYIYFLSGLACIATISFIDDIRPVRNGIRIIFHLIAVALLFYQTGMFMLPVYWSVLALILVIGSINAINFMDGINGITGSYALVTLSTLYYVNKVIAPFVDDSLLVVVILSVVVFNFFNFRKKAKCFAGDVGSVSIAFIIMFLMILLIKKTENFNYLLLLLLYGLDTTTTIFFRLMRKENIFEAHRSHFYQFWANERKVSHLQISALYALIQLVINAAVIFLLPDSALYLFLALFFSATLFITIRFNMEGSARLLDLKN